MKLYHNPRCSKSRNCLAYLEEKGYAFESVNYLDEGITEEELKDIIVKSGKTAFDFVRTHEQDYKDLYAGKELSAEEWVKILVNNTQLLVRPIVVNGDKAVHAMPPERVEEIR
ncbi:MAG: arsenate reductase family protein [Bacteroidales bacterium]|nr:arsenate reductase family protein [Bacteroidales bacterium]